MALVSVSRARTSIVPWIALVLGLPAAVGLAWLPAFSPSSLPAPSVPEAREPAPSGPTAALSGTVTATGDALVAGV